MRILRQRLLRRHQLLVPEHVRLPHLRPRRQRARVAHLIIHSCPQAPLHRGRLTRRHVRDMNDCIAIISGCFRSLPIIIFDMRTKKRNVSLEKVWQGRTILAHQIPEKSTKHAHRPQSCLRWRHPNGDRLAPKASSLMSASYRGRMSEGFPKGVSCHRALP